MRFMAFWTVPMMSTPTTVPVMVPTPPESETPPSTQAEMTSSEKPVEVLGWPLVMREARITPASPAIRPCSDEDGDLDPVHGDAGEPGGLLVAADGEGVAAEAWSC